MKTLKLLVLLVSTLVASTIAAQQDTFKVSVSGHGNPILLLPGFSCPGEVFDELVSELSKTHECHVFTFAGFAAVPPIESPWLPKIKEGIEQYIQDNKLQSITLIGHSLGGTLSLWLGTNPHISLSKIITIDALPSYGALMIPNFESTSIVYDSPYTQQMLNMDKVAFETMAKQIASGMVLNQEKVDTIKKWIVESDRKTYVYGYTDLLKLDLREDLAKIQAPIIVLGATEPYGLQQATNTFKTQYKNSENYRLHLAEDSAHFIMYDQPQWLLETILKELNSNP